MCATARRPLYWAPRILSPFARHGSNRRATAENQNAMQASTAPVTFLFTDIEGSTRLWETAPAQMRDALARHDALGQDAVLRHSGRIVKTTGDGMHAVFDDPLDAIAATIALQQALADPAATAGIALRVRCGLHLGVDERRDNDFFGRAVNRAARIMSAAHGGQVLVSEAVYVLVRDRLPGGVELRDLGQVRLRDLTGPEQLYQVVHPALRESFPVPRSLEATPNNLPQQVTSFIGRERELKEVKGLLAGTRLLTLTGPGGIGKTRLSLQVAADMQDDYPDGVWFVDLAPVTDERVVTQSLASVLGVKEDSGGSIQKAVESHVRNMRALIILDNCEHLVRACAELARSLLQHGPSLDVLASSREPLSIAGETTYPVPTLAFPGISRMFTAASLAPFESVHLFAARASAAQPSFQVTDANAAAVADICQHLDGIPLAIELAAARVRGLSVENIAARLSDRFGLLAKGDRTALPRQQTLRALIDWSYDLLAPDERLLFQRLAVFAGNFTLEAAEAVCSDAGLDRDNVLGLLTQLVEKSLVTLESGGQRYRLLDTVRHYALGRLRESGEEDAIRSAHLDCYLALVEKARPELEGPQQADWLEVIDFERENILSAHEFCNDAANGAELGRRLATATKPYWFMRGLLGLGFRVSVEALNRLEKSTNASGRCHALFDAGQYCSFMGRYAEARDFLQESLALARALGDKRLAAEALQPLGLAWSGLGELATAREYLEEGLALARDGGSRRELAAALNSVAQLDRSEGKLDDADVLYADVVELARELGDLESVALGLLNRAIVATGRGDVEAARGMLVEVIALTDATGIGRPDKACSK